MKPQKLFHEVDGEWVPHRHPPVYRRERHRLVAGVPDGDADLFESLLVPLEGPFHLLYVLHTPRGEAHPGRYQSPLLDKPSVIAWLRTFAGFFAADARFDLWLHDPAISATLVWDRHNLLYAYGPIERFANCLSERAFSEGELSIPSPHEHHYRAEFDAEARSLMASQAWSMSPLRPEDEQ